jgi:hypothetical protein
MFFMELLNSKTWLSKSIGLGLISLALTGCIFEKKLEQGSILDKSIATVVAPQNTGLVITFQFFNADGSDAGDLLATFDNQRLPYGFIKGDEIRYQVDDELWLGTIGDIRQSVGTFVHQDKWSQDLVVNIDDTTVSAVPTDFEFDIPENSSGPITTTFPNHTELSLKIIFRDASGITVHETFQKFINQRLPYQFYSGERIREIVSGTEYAGYVSNVKHDLTVSTRERTWQQRVIVELNQSTALALR